MYYGVDEAYLKILNAVRGAFDKRNTEDLSNAIHRILKDQ